MRNNSRGANWKAKVSRISNSIKANQKKINLSSILQGHRISLKRKTRKVRDLVLCQKFPGPYIK